jgi:alcohol dehydrogenase, propanol-preferring
MIDEKLELAEDLGAEWVVNAARQDPVEAIQRLGGADQAIALAVSPAAFAQAYASLRRGGTLAFVALPAENEVTIPIFETVLNGIMIVGSIVGTRTDAREVFELHAAGKTRVIRALGGQSVDRGRTRRHRAGSDRLRAVAGSVLTIGRAP